MCSVLLQINNLNGYTGTFYIVINLFYITVIVYYSTPLVGNMSVDGLPCQKGRHLYFQSEIELNFHNTSSQIKFCLRLLLSFFLGNYSKFVFKNTNIQRSNRFTQILIIPLDIWFAFVNQIILNLFCIMSNRFVSSFLLNRYYLVYYSRVVAMVIVLYFA